MHTKTRTHLVLFAVVILALLMAAAGWPLRQALGPEAGPALAAGRVPDDTTTWRFGPQLWLVRASAPDLAALANIPGLTFHTRLAGDLQQGRTAYIASGDAQAAERLVAAGTAYTVLDADTTGQVYYFVDAPTQDAAGRSQAAALGRVVYEGEAELLLAVPAAQERALLDALPGQGLAIARLSAAPLAAAAQPAGLQPGRALASTDPVIAGLLAQVQPSALYNRIADLSGVWPVNVNGRSVTMATRYFFGSYIHDVEEYTYNYYAGLGLPTSYDYWTYGNYSGRNVIADIPGRIHPERVWLIGGHFDSNSNVPYSSAPGADDNGSGMAATMVIADLLSHYRFADTVRFVNFSAEELGEWGSKTYAADLRAAGVQVQGYIDLDMIGWDGNNDRVVEIHTGTGAASQTLGSAFISANSRYGQGLVIEDKQSSASRFSDHSSFWDNGFASFLAIENFYDDTIPRDRNPYYHNTGDTLDRVNLDYVLRYTRAALATIAELAGMDTAPTPTPTATHTPTPTNTPTPTATPTPIRILPPNTCLQRVSNNGFESDGRWVLAGAFLDGAPHSGLRSARLGLLPSPGASAVPPKLGNSNLLRQTAGAAGTYSYVYQPVSFPDNSTTITLTFWYRPGSETRSASSQRVLLLRSSDNAIVADLLSGLDNSDQWQSRTFDLAAFAGQDLVLYFEVYNATVDPGARTWMLVDDVSLLACNGQPVRGPIPSYLPHTQR